MVIYATKGLHIMTPSRAEWWPLRYEKLSVGNEKFDRHILITFTTIWFLISDNRDFIFKIHMSFKVQFCFVYQ